MMQQMKLVLSHTSLLKIAFINMLFMACNVLVATIMPSFGAIYFTKCDINTNANCELNYNEYNFYNSIFLSIVGVVAFLFTGYVASISDCIGRKVLIFIPILLCFIPRVVMIFNPNIFLYLGMSIAFGFNGGKDAIPPSFQAYVSDIVPQNIKTLGFGILFASHGIGCLFGANASILLIYLYGTNYEIIWTFVDILHIISMLFIIFCLNESLLPQNRKTISEINIYNPFEPLLHIRENIVVFWVSIIYFMASLPTCGIVDVMLVYISDQLNLNASNSNLISSVVIQILGISGIFGNTILLPFMKQKLNMTDITIVKIITIATLIWFLIWALLPYIPHVYIAIIGGVIGGFGMMAYPALNSILTNYVEDNEHGKAFGIVQTAQAVTITCAPFVFGIGYNISKEYLHFPALPLIIAMILVAISYILISNN
eukprot:96892_1